MGWYIGSSALDARDQSAWVWGEKSLSTSARNCEKCHVLITICCNLVSSPICFDFYFRVHFSLRIYLII
jgi:hypothetical protein